MKQSIIQNNPEFIVKITDYKKRMNSMEAYITFNIECEKNTEKFNVERRYNDFLWLDYRLTEKYPVFILPPLSQKHNITALERFEGSFIDQRKAALEIYIKRLSSHPIISCDDILWSFLTQSETNFENTKKQNPLPGKLESLKNSLTNLSAGYRSGASSNKKLISYKVEKTLENGSNLSSVMNRLCRVLKRTSEIWDELNYLDPALTLRNDGWNSLSGHAEICANISTDLIDDLEPWVRESSLYWDQVLKAAKRRDSLEEKFLTSSIIRSESMEGSGGQRTYDGNSNNYSAETVDKLHDKVSKSSADLESEVDQFCQQRSVETKQWLIQFSETHIKHYSSACDIWRQMIINSNSEAAWPTVYPKIF